MNFLTLTRIEFKKIRRSKILLLFFAAAVILWLPPILNASINFEMQSVGISPENNFFIQGFLGISWFLFPASMVVLTVLLTQTERANRGILKMLALPVSSVRMCLAKFVVLLTLAAVQMILFTGMYFISAHLAGWKIHYDFLIDPLLVCKTACIVFLCSIPMLACFWMFSICVQTPIFSMGLGLASIVPSVLIINSKFWFAYPMAYPFYAVTAEYGKLADNLSTPDLQFFPWIWIAAFWILFCLCIACFSFGRAERR